MGVHWSAGLLHDNLSCCAKITSYNPGQKSLGQYCNIHIFLSFLDSLLKQCILFKIFLQFSLLPPYTKLKLGKNAGYMRPTLFVGWGEGLDLCELENASEMQSVARLLSMIVAYHVDVLRALCCVPSPLLDKSKESMCGRLKLSPFFNILLLVKENIRDLKCLHRFEMPSVRIVLHQLQNISQWKRYHGVWRSLKKMLRRR